MTLLFLDVLALPRFVAPLGDFSLEALAINLMPPPPTPPAALALFRFLVSRRECFQLVQNYVTSIDDAWVGKKAETKK